jgi:hypothetical protein
LRGGGIEALEAGKQGDVDEVEQFVAGDAFGVGGPVAPAQMLGQRRFVVVAQHFQFGFLVVEDFQEQQPGELGDALGVAVHAGVLAHDVLDGFDETGADGHSGWGGLVVGIGGWACRVTLR